MKKKNLINLENCTKIEVEKDKGLTSDQVDIRKREGLTNEVKKRATKSYGKIIFDNLVNPLNVILMIIFVFMVIGGLKISRFFFVVILICNSSVGLIQDIKARSLISKLSIMTEPKCIALRDGKEVEISTSEIVLDDIIIIKNGDQVPTDCEIIEGNCSANESLLTGESVPIHKTESDNLLSGSYLTSGIVKARATHVGRFNYIEALQEKASLFKRPSSEIKRSINFIISFCIVCVAFFGILYTITYSLTNNILNHDEYSVFIETLSGSLVSMIPSGMYLLTSLTLAIGVIVLARKRMLVQELYCIEMLARTDVVCLDKTGTLTSGEMSVEEIIPTDKLTKNEIIEVLKKVIWATGDSNSTTRALKKAYPQTEEIKVKKYIPFDSSIKYSAVELEDGSTAAIGAFGFVNSITTKKVEEVISSYSKEGFRIICVYTNKKPFKNDAMPMMSTLVGLVLISNEIKSDAPDNIKWFQDNGVKVKIISGDNPLTVSHIAKLCNVNNYDKFINCEGVSNEKLVEIAEEYAVFGRVSPEQKELLVSTLKSHKHTVAMTGDGVNDILALKTADCSISMANGSSAARNVSHIVSLDNGFSKLPDVVEEGRRVINNLQRSCSLFLSKTLFAVLVTLFFDIAFFFDHSIIYPFVTSNMLIWEMISIGIASFFLALQPSKERLEGSFKLNIILKAVPSGFAESCAVFAAYLYCNAIIHQPEMFVTLAVLAFTFMSYVVLFKICLPLDKYRLAVFGGSCFLAILVFLINFLVPSLDLLAIDSSVIDLGCILAAVCIVVICSGIYFLLDFLTGKKLKELKER